MASCKKSNSGASGANVMFINACTAGITPVYLDADDSNTNKAILSGLHYHDTLGYQQVTPGSGITLSFVQHGLNKLCSHNADLAAGSHYSAFAGGSVVQPRFVFLTDDLTAPDTNAAKIRFVNLSPDSIKVSCYVNEIRIAKDLIYPGNTPFVNTKIPATTKVYVVYETALTDTIFACYGDDELYAGTIYTFVLSGSDSGATYGSTPIGLHRIQNK